MRFKEKVVFITGAGSGIGQACAVQFAKDGARLAISDWNSKGLEATRKMISDIGSEVHAYQLDVSQYTQVKEVLSNVSTVYGRLDIALNNAGIGGQHTFRTAEHTLDDWDKVIAVNQSGVFYCMKEELSIMMPKKRGSIVNVSSIAGLRALPRQLAYVASKHAVIGMSKTASSEYARYGIRVNAVCPVFTNSPLLEKMFEMKTDLREKLVHSIPVGRYGEVSDIVNAILWLSDDKSSFITGLALPVDGGQSA